MEITSGDPIADLILTGKAQSLEEAEAMYLDAHIDDVIRLIESDLPDQLLRRHPLIQLLLARGSRFWEDALL